ncbi:unnamed protein product [Cyprideis torosa]|uniref:poly(A)-specific ribonuclease n=1 Tax=Cyprideis torosa TaxID=163714 RepID=A0A7R8ZPK3_9CRUS|nr:unnamed protein product [Cyprideis torosa]CAG0899084.1 unnamed protein product [Cyprideis torosa]
MAGGPLYVLITSPFEAGRLRWKNLTVRVLQAVSDESPLVYTTEIPQNQTNVYLDTFSKSVQEMMMTPYKTDYAPSGIGNQKGAGPRRTHTIMSTEEAASGKPSRWTELEISGPVRFLSPHLFQPPFTNLTSLYLNNNHLPFISGAIGNMVHLLTLDLSNNKIRMLPPEIGDLVNLRELLLTNNSIRTLPFELGKLFKLVNLGLKGNPLPKELFRLHSEPNGLQKLLMYLLDNLPGIFTVLCYNVLCDKYATRQMYGYCPSWALTWEYRKKGIMEQIRHYAADIMTLQEVETDQFYDFFLPELKMDGFQLVKEQVIEFNQIAMACHEGSDDMLNRVMTKDNIGLTALLQTKEKAWENNVSLMRPEASSSEQNILVCTCHIHWDPEFCDVKLIQTMMLTQELTSQRDNTESSEPPLLLLCGDFNSLPDSGVTEFLSTSRVSLAHRDFKGLAYQECLTKLLSNKIENSKSDQNIEQEYRHPFNLTSSYNTDIMAYTNYTFDFKGMIDYIFHNADRMRTLGVLGPLDQSWLEEYKVVGAPHVHIPSDHFPLLVELELEASPGDSIPKRHR